MDFAAQLEEIMPGDPRNAELASRFETATDDLFRTCRLFPDAFDLLVDIKALDIDVFVSSSTSHDIVARFCARAGITDLVKGVSGLIPDETKLDQLRQIKAATGLRRGQILFVGDSLFDAETANGAGISFVGVARLFTSEEFAGAGVPSVGQPSELGPLLAAAHARLRMLGLQGPRRE